MGLTYRQTKGSALTFQELDANFEYFTGSHSVTGSVIISGSQEIVGSQSITGSFNLTGSIATIVSGTEQFTGTQQLTGTQTIVGTQTITGSQYLTGSSVINGTLDVFGTVTMVSGSSIIIETQYITGSSIISGSQKISGSQDIFGTTTMTGSLGVSGSITFVGDQVISGSINFGDNGLIQSTFDITISASDDVRIIANDVLSLRNYSPSDSIDIRTDYNGNNYTWEFNSDGNTLFPYLTTPRGDINSGDLITNTLKLGDGTNEAVISTPDGTDGYPNSQRLVINPGQGSGSSEGGDIYLWAGRGGVDGGSGGDIKVRGGYGPLTGGGGYIRIEGGDTTDGTAGFVEIKGGNSNTAQGGDVYIYGGQGNGNTQNGNVTINTYDSVGTTKTWTFDTNGTLNTPGNVTVSGSLDVTGNIISTGSLILQPDVSDIRYLEIYNTSAQDTHITASGGWLFLGDDITYIKVDNYSTNNLIELRADNGVAVSGSLNVTGSQVVINTDNFKVRVNDQDGIVIDTTGIYIQDEQGSGAIEASTTNRLLYDSTTGISVDWNNRQLLKSDGTTVAFDWENGILTSSLYGTASWSDNATTASYVENAQTASYVETAQTASYYIAPTASSTPGGTAPEGSFTFVVDGGNCFIYAYINGGWKSGSLV